MILSRPLLDFYIDLSEEKGVVRVVENSIPIYIAQFIASFGDTYLLSKLYHSSWSPDSISIYHVWNILKGWLNKRRIVSENAIRLYSTILEEWQKINADSINSSVYSMSNRAKRILNSKRKHLQNFFLFCLYSST